MTTNQEIEPDEPGPEEPDTVEPDETEAVEPESDEPDTVEPDESEAVEPESDEPDAGEPEEPDQESAPPRTVVLVNLLWLVPGLVGGSEESTTDALRDLSEDLPGDIDVHLAVLRPFVEAHPDLADRFSVVVLDQDGLSKPSRVWAEQTWLASQTRRLGATVVHHAGGVVPLRHPGRVVLTIHDLQPLDLPENFSTLKRIYIRMMAGRSTRAADLVVVPSEFTRGRVIDLLGVQPDRVRVVPWSFPAYREIAAAGEPARPAEPAEPARSSTISSLGAGRYFLYPAITYPHKNHAVLLDAFAQLLAEHPEYSASGDGVSAERPVQLVLTGREGPTEASVVARFFQPDLAGRVVRPGRVAPDELARLYAGAAAVVVPSRYEGFGLPVLEAMGRGVPVIAARAGSLPEVARAEDLIDPDDVAGWAEAMHAALSMTSVDRAARIVAGRVVASRFSPARTSTGLIDAYRGTATDVAATDDGPTEAGPTTPSDRVPDLIEDEP